VAFSARSRLTSVLLITAGAVTATVAVLSVSAIAAVASNIAARAELMVLARLIPCVIFSFPTVLSAAFLLSLLSSYQNLLHNPCQHGKGNKNNTMILIRDLRNLVNHEIS
jgi:hypothetical protein